MARKVDRRILRTRKLLRESMLALIMERGYDEISIQDVTDKANLGRATFYLHFKEKDDLLTDLMQQMFKDFAVQDSQKIDFKWYFEDEKVLQKVFEFAENNYDFYRIMIFGKGGVTASRMLQQNIASAIQLAIENEIEQTHAEPILPINYMVNHLAGELLSCIYWWLESDMAYSPQEMAHMYNAINSHSRDQLLKLPESKNIVSAFLEDRREKSRERRKKNKNGLESKAEDTIMETPKKQKGKRGKEAQAPQPSAEEHIKAPEELASNNE